MAGGRADAERLAIPELSSDLRSYVARMQQGQALVEQRLRAAGVAAERSITEARRGLLVAVERLDACRREEDADCSWAAAAVDTAKQHLEEMYAVARDIAELGAQYQPVTRRFSAALNTLGQQAQRELTRAGDTLDIYLGSSPGGRGATGSHAGGSPSSPTSSSASGPASSLIQPVGFPTDVVMVPLSLIDDSDSHVNGAEDFGKGYTPADLEWAHEAFVGVIVPGVAKGLSLDDFRARDQREGKMGTRSYADTYSGFFGDSKITLDASGSNFTVVNGYHRVWVARNMGLDAVPAKVA